MGAGDLAAKERRDHKEATCHVGAGDFIASCERFGLLQCKNSEEEDLAGQVGGNPPVLQSALEFRLGWRRAKLMYLDANSGIPMTGPHHSPAGVKSVLHKSYF
jgi:hypothetical protein